MKRLAYNELLKWKQNKNKKPLIIKGARQVGKTWLIKEFAKNEYSDSVYINFEDKRYMQELFEQDFNIERIIFAFETEANIKIIPQKTLIILDEIQEAKRGLTSLKYFQEHEIKYDVIAAGSYLGISMQKGVSFPVGKVDFLNLKPLNFIEFMMAMNYNNLVELIMEKDWQLIKMLKNKYIELLKKYFYVGGMPEAVKHFAENNNFDEVRKIQNNILLAYEHDFAKHISGNIVQRIRMVWNSIPSQLAKENKKFLYKLIKKGARAKEFEVAIEWLIESDLIIKIYRITKAGIPLKAYVDLHAFKLFLVDIGLLGALSNLDKSTITEGNRIFEEFKGAFIEQFVCQQLPKDNLFYWSAERSNGEIDFVLQNQNRVIPIEVKSTENLKAKSLKYFEKKYKLNSSIRISMSDYRDEGWMKNIPLYCVNLIGFGDL